MRFLSFSAAWIAVALILPVAPTAGQDNEPDVPYVFFSPSPDEPGGKPKAPLRALNLRPNQEQTFFVYVHNPTAQKKSVAVQLGSTVKVGGRDQEMIAAAAAAVEVEAGKSVRVNLAANKANVPAPAPGEKAAALPVIPLQGDKGFVKVFGEKALIELRDVSTYAETEKTGAGKTLDLTVSVKKGLNFPLVGGPIPVRATVYDKSGAVVPAEKLGAPGNVLSGQLATGPGADGAPTVALKLNTEGLGEAGVVEVSIDGVPRAARWTTGGEKAKAPVGATAPAFAASGKPLTALVIGDGVAADPIQVAFGDTVKRLPRGRNDGIDVRIGPSGEAIFITRAQDWAVEFPTAGLTGRRDLVVRDAAGKALGKAFPVELDATAPKVGPIKVTPIPTTTVATAPVPPPLKAGPRKFYRPGERVHLSVEVTEDVSRVDPESVLFFVGEQPGPDGKAPVGSAVRKGVAGPGDLYEVDIDLPAAGDRTEVVAGVVVANQLGLKAVARVAIPVDPTPPVVSVIDVLPKKDTLVPHHPGDVVRLVATAVDPESGIDLSKPVRFFMGDAPALDGAPTQGTLEVKVAGVIPGAKAPSGAPLWAADFTIPEAIKREVDLKMGVWFVNGAGLPAVQIVTIKAAPSIPPNAGEVKVKVVQGSSDRLQEGVPVRLIDQANTIAAQGVTDECGRVKFEKVLPGRYIVQAVKPADGNAQGFKVITVLAGESTEATLSLMR